MDILDPDQGKMTIYGSDFQQVNLTSNGGVSPTGDIMPNLIFKHIHNNLNKSNNSPNSEKAKYNKQNTIFYFDIQSVFFG